MWLAYPSHALSGEPVRRSASVRSIILGMFSRLSRMRKRFPLSTALPLAFGLLLRMWFVHHDPDLSGDPLLYGAIARNLLQHGVYGFDAGVPTLIRLPGYPLFLAGCFRVFGVEHYYPVLYFQVVVDLLGCVLLARLASRLASAPFKERAATATLWLAALCPFTACYTAAPLTETLELFSTTAALLAFARALHIGSPPTLHLQTKNAIDGKALAVSVLFWTYAALLRPDGALLGVTLCAALLLHGFRHGIVRRALTLAALSALASLLAFLPWTLRNWHTFHVFEPLAPRYATDPGEPTNPGFQRWTKTVCADLACTSEVYWAADDTSIALNDLPTRAFDSPQQFRQTADLLADYNRHTTITPALDARFAALAQERAAAHPVRTSIGMPLLRLLDMWLRPRTELFNMDLRWWHYRSEGADTVLAYALGALNLLYLALALVGGLRKPPMLGVFAAFILLRCALLWTIEAPEPRYTLECFPMILVLDGLLLAPYFSASRYWSRPAPSAQRQATASR